MKRKCKRSEDRQGRLQFGATIEHFEAFARRGDPKTAQVAASTCNASWSEFMVLTALSHIERGTAEDITADVKRRFPEWEACQQSMTPRMAPLRRKGFIEDAGVMVNDSKHEAIAFRLTAAGLQQVRDGFKGRSRHRKAI